MVLFPVAGQCNEISPDFHDRIKFAVEDNTKTRFQTTDRSFLLTLEAK